MTIVASISDASDSYEAWLHSRVNVVEADLLRKHQVMAKNAFTFLRATYYRWTQLWPDCCESLADAPRVLAVGDLHTENFGTWRDADGRLAWGVNDFGQRIPHGRGPLRREQPGADRGRPPEPESRDHPRRPNPDSTNTVIETDETHNCTASNTTMTVTP